MARKTLKQKLKHQLREVRNIRDAEHSKAGVTINFEVQAMQAVGLGHGLMAGLLAAKNILGIESPQYKEIEAIAQERIAQCFLQLVQMGIDPATANLRITQGH